MFKFLVKKYASRFFFLLAIVSMLSPTQSGCMESDMKNLKWEETSEGGFWSDVYNYGIPAIKRAFDGRIPTGNSEIKDDNHEHSNLDKIETYGEQPINQDTKKFSFWNLPEDISTLIENKANAINNNIDSKWNKISNNKYEIAGGAVAAIVSTVILVKVTQLLSEKAINWIAKNDPKFLATTHQKIMILEKVKKLMGIKEDNALFKNKENSENISAFILRNNLISQLDNKDIAYKNLVLTGPDAFVKFKICENISNNSGQKLVVINTHSVLFNQSINDDQKRILVKNFFDKLQSNGINLVVVNMDNISIEQLENNGSKNILIDIINFSKNRSNKIGFVFACPSIEGEFKKLLEGSYDEVINVERPDKNSREQLISHMVNKVILNNSNSMLQKMGIKSLLISKEKQEAFKVYLTAEKISWIVESLEGKSYQEVQSFVLQLRALLGQKAISPISNYDPVINILLNRSESDLLRNLLAKTA